MLEDISFYVIPDVGERQDNFKQYHVYCTDKRKGNCLNFSKTRGLIGKDVDNQAPNAFC